MPESKIVKREELFKAVWERPMVHVARDYEISDVGLKKICKKMFIPTPGRGYWRRKEQGYKVIQSKLPKLPAGVASEVSISPSHYAQDPAGTIPSAEEIRIKEVLNPAVHASEEHQLVQRARESLRKAKADEKGILCPRAKRLISLAVTDDTLSRALLVSDILIKALEELGHRVTINDKKMPKLRVVVNDEDIGISIEEKISAQPYEPKPGDRGRSAWQLPRYDYMPTGRLTVRLHGDFPTGLRVSWSDGKVQRIELITEKILCGIYAAAVAQTQKRIDDERREREWEEQRRKDEEARKLRRLEMQRQKHLEKLALQYEEALRVQLFVEAVEKSLEMFSEIQVQDMDMASWLEWAKEYSAQLNPLKYQHWWDIEKQVSLWSVRENYF